MDIEKTKELILVVDDTNGCAKLLKELLGALQFATASTSSGAEALTCSRRRVQPFFWRTMRMPEMSGMELIRRLRRAFRTCRLLLR